MTRTHRLGTSGGEEPTSIRPSAAGSKPQGSSERAGTRFARAFAAGLLAAVATTAACAAAQGGPEASAGDESGPTAARQRMVEEQIAARGVTDPRVLEAMREVPRHLFVPPELAGRAYRDEPLPIGHRQTISQPYVVALMCELAALGPDDRVLEIGTGSGYHAAVLARLAAQVFTIEIVPELAALARATLAEMGIDGIEVRTGDGYRGWPEEAPFDAIVLTAAPAEIPQPLLDQLAPGGRLVAPVGEGVQQLTVITRVEDGFERRSVVPVRFVPMVRGGLFQPPSAGKSVVFPASPPSPASPVRPVGPGESA